MKTSISSASFSGWVEQGQPTRLAYPCPLVTPRPLCPFANSPCPFSHCGPLHRTLTQKSDTVRPSPLSVSRHNPSPTLSFSQCGPHRSLTQKSDTVRPSPVSVRHNPFPTLSFSQCGPHRSLTQKSDTVRPSPVSVIDTTRFPRCPFLSVGLTEV